MSINPRLLSRRVVSMISSSGRPRSSKLLNSTPSSARAWASAASGWLPGRNWAMRQLVPALVILPWCRAGRRPQFTNEDLPLPEVPTTARKRRWASLSTMAST